VIRKMVSATRVLRNDSPWEQVAHESNLPVFGGELIEFTSRLSSAILQNRQVKRFPELVALGFWLRRGNILAMKKDFGDRIISNEVKLPRGLIFHIAPANVDTIFVYSWIISLLCGNRNILRISSRNSIQLEYLLAELERVLGDPASRSIAKRLSLLRYPANDQITGAISSKVDARVIWGGDKTVRHIRSIAIPPTAQDIPFPNKWSLAVLDVDYWVGLDSDAKRSLAESFANDAYQFGQAACSSPRAVVWLTQRTVRLDMSEFWEYVSDSLAGIFDFSDVDFVSKLVSSDCLAAQSVVQSVRSIRDNRVVTARIGIESLQEIVQREDQCDGGFFFEMQTDTLDGLFGRIGRKLQTVSYAGVPTERWDGMLREENPGSVDRIVPIGEALDFSSTWDGVYLFDAFTRCVTTR